jgi:hypothetical protein
MPAPEAGTIYPERNPAIVITLPRGPAMPIDHCGQSVGHVRYRLPNRWRQARIVLVVLASSNQK